MKTCAASFWYILENVSFYKFIDVVILKISLQWHTKIIKKFIKNSFEVGYRRLANDYLKYSDWLL